MILARIIDLERSHNRVVHPFATPGESMPRPNLKLSSLSFSCVKYPLAAFLIVLAARVVPEVLMGPYPLGFDTVAHYLPSTISWLDGSVDFWHCMTAPPLLYAFLTVAVASGLPLTLTLKMVSSLLHGLLALVICYYSHRGLSWSPMKSLFTSLLACLYFVSLRISWDQLQLELGLVFTFLALTLLCSFDRAKNRRKGLYALLSLVMALVSLSYPLCSFLVLLIVSVRFLALIRRKEYSKARDLTAVSIPAMLIFALNIFSRWLLSSRLPIISTVALSGPLSYQEVLLSTVGLTIYCYLPLLPLATIGTPYLKTTHVRIWIAWSLVPVLSPLVSPTAYITGSYRWTYMLAFPLVFLTIEGFTTLKSMARSRAKLFAFISVAASFALIVSWLTAGFITKPPESPLWYFDQQKYNRYIFFIPSSMLQNTVSIRDTDDLLKALNWLDLNIDHESVLILPKQFYGWALVSIEETARIVAFEELSPFSPSGVEDLLSESHKALEDNESAVYTIWWAPDHGWYGIESLPSDFVEVERFGRLSIYLYAESVCAEKLTEDVKTDFDVIRLWR